LPRVSIALGVRTAVAVFTLLSANGLVADTLGVTFAFAALALTLAALAATFAELARLCLLCLR